MIPVDTHLIEDIGKRDPVRKSMEFFEQNSYGIRPFELGIEVKGDSTRIDDREVLVELEKIQGFLGQDDRLSPMLSMVSFLKAGNKLYRRQERLPESQEEIDIQTDT